MSEEDLPLTGVKVIELTTAIAGPTCAALLGDYGASVYKVEPPGGDTQRYALAGLTKTPSPYQASPAFYQIARNKKSIVLNLKDKIALKALHTLLSKADVFVSNFRLDALRRLGLGPKQMHEAHPGLVICVMTGRGFEGPDASKPTYDVAGFWAISGAAHTHRKEGKGFPPMLGPGFGDLTTGMAALGGVTSALYKKSRTGKGSILTTSLLRTGIYANGWASSMYFARDREPRWGVRNHTGNPMSVMYETKDGKLIQLLGMQSAREWPKLCRAMGWDENNPKYIKGSLRRQHEKEIVSNLELGFASKNRDEWMQILDKEDVWYAPVLNHVEAINDPQSIASGAFVEYPKGPADLNAEKQFDKIRNVAAPVDFMNSKTMKPIHSIRQHVPAVGEHTGEILEEFGVDSNDISKLVTAEKSSKL